MTRSSNKLKDVQLKNAKPKEKPYRMTDGGGLYLLVNPDGAKYWRLRYRFNGKENTLALGVYPSVTLNQARGKREEERARLAQGVNPSDHRKSQKLQHRSTHSNSFEKIAREWYEHRKPEWKNEKHRKQVITTLERLVFPAIGRLPIEKISTGEVLKTIRNIEQRGTLETASRTLQRVNAVFMYAVTVGLITNNPAGGLSKVLKTRVKGELPYILVKDLPPLLKQLEVYQGEPQTIIAIKLLMLTFVRPGELRGARWGEFELGGNEKIWRIPAERMKRSVEHLVPLSTQAHALVEELRRYTGFRELLFPNRANPSQPMSDMTMNKAIKSMGVDMVGHGFRKTASTWLHETGYTSDAIERQLAHCEKDKVKAAYNKAQHLEERRRMMQDWADLIDSLKESNNVVPIHSAG